MGRPDLTFLLRALRGLRWCMVCGTPLPALRAWQRGPLRPVDLCPRGERWLCHDRGVRRGWL